MPKGSRLLPRSAHRASPAASVSPDIAPGLAEREIAQGAGEALSLARSAVQSMFSTDRASQNLGLEILDVAPGNVRVCMTVRPEMVNGHGLCHGGIIFALADSAFAFACNSHGQPMVAAGASIEFLAPTPAGERLTALATEVFRGARHGVYDVRVAKSSGETVALFRGRSARLRSSAPNGTIS
jgi:acyl-CoA thioesterase